MASKTKRALVVVFAMAAIGVGVSSAVQVGRAYEQRSLYSYLLKTGDADAASAAALRHVKGAKSRGLTVAAQLATASILLGVALGAFVGQVMARNGKNR